MKVLLINTNVGYGGASKMMAFVANYLAQMKHDVTFLTYRDEKELQTLDKNVNHVHVQWEKTTGNTAGSLIKSVLELRTFLKKGNYDIAIAFLSPSQLRLAFSAIGIKTKVLFSQRGDPYNTIGNKYSPVNILNKIAFGLADGYVFQTTGAMQFYNKRIQNKGCIIANPIKKQSDGLMWNVKKTKKRIVSVGRMDLFQKRQDLMIKAFEIYSKSYPGYTLEFYGDGDDLEKVKALAKDNKSIIFHGAVQNVLEKIVDAEMFVMTSDFEGIPNALLEVMSIGMPCVSTKCSPGGAELIIDDKINGLLVEKGNVHAIANAMISLSSDKSLSKMIGENAQKVNIIFSPERIENQWINVINNLSAGNKNKKMSIM